MTSAVWIGVVAGVVAFAVGFFLLPSFARLIERPRVSTREAIKLSNWDGKTPHPDLSVHLALVIRSVADELVVCKIDHPEDERLFRAEAGLRWLLGERV